MNADYHPREAYELKEIQRLQRSIHERVEGCHNVRLLAEIEQMLVAALNDEELLSLDDDDIRDLLRELLDH